MKKYELNPKEQVKYDIKPNVFDQERKNKRILLLGVVCAAAITWFFYYVTSTISSFYPLFLMMAVLTGIGLVYYLISLIRGVLRITDEHYYITNVRLIIVNKDNDIIKEVYLSKINKTITEKVAGSSYNIIINPREETDPKKLRSHKGSKPLYTADTIVLHAVNLNLVKDMLVK